MLWKFVCNLRFHEVLQTSIFRRIMKGKEEIEKSSQKLLELCRDVCVLLSVCVFVCVCVGCSCVLLRVDV